MLKISDLKKTSLSGFLLLFALLLFVLILVFYSNKVTESYVDNAYPLEYFSKIDSRKGLIKKDETGCGCGN